MKRFSARLAILLCLSLILAGCDLMGPERNGPGVRVIDTEWVRDGQPVRVYRLTNSHGMSCEILNYGATLKSLHVPDAEGAVVDVVQGFDRVADYWEKKNPFFGATVGRYANRIRNASFELDGRTYRLASNNKENHIHGGVKGFDKVMWEAAPVEEAGRFGVRLHYLSPDGEENYPGALSTTLTCWLTEGNALELRYEARTTKPTVLNFTNHSYFNLNGHDAGSVLDHELRIQARSYVESDPAALPTGEIRPVARTPLDFRKFKTLGRDVDADHPAIRAGKGYDHTWVLGMESSREPRLAAELRSTQTSRTLTVRTTEPGMHVYTANGLKGKVVGKGGTAYERRSSVCLETMHFTDSPNQQHFPSTVLRPGQTFQSVTIYDFATR